VDDKKDNVTSLPSKAPAGAPAAPPDKVLSYRLIADHSKGTIAFCLAGMVIDFDQLGVANLIQALTEKLKEFSK
jgi:hypothetical protein